jgi:hypothetical protein
VRLGVFELTLLGSIERSSTVRVADDTSWSKIHWIVVIVIIVEMIDLEACASLLPVHEFPAVVTRMRSGTNLAIKHEDMFVHPSEIVPVFFLLHERMTANLRSANDPIRAVESSFHVPREGFEPPTRCLRGSCSTR